MIDNREHVRRFISPRDMKAKGDDAFWYTELLDRTTNGSSRFKMLRTFEHNDREHFDEQMDTIALLCERNNVRAYTRLSPRSRRQVGFKVLQQVVQSITDGHFDALWHVYGSACGSCCIHDRKLWLWDVDEPTEESEELCVVLSQMGKFRARIPSRKGYHIITPGLDVRDFQDRLRALNITIHKDNPTNLYIPESAK